MHNYPPDPAARIEAATATVRTELARAEAKATGLLGIAGAALTVILAAQTVHRLPTAALVIGAAATLTTAVAIGLLAWVLRPNLGTGRAGWLGYSGLTATQIHRRAADETEGDLADQLAFLADLARRKYLHIRAAVHLLLVVVALVVAGGIITAVVR